MAKKPPYQPPRQSKLGQVVDSLFLLGLVFLALFAPLYLGLAGGGKTTLEFAEKTWSGLGQNATMAAQWEKLGYTPETAAELISSRFDYSFSLTALLVTAIVVIAYFYILFHWSKKEYKEVIAEKFNK
jgi:ABC-type antimicrobial peptide transport system permease subunit